MNEERYVLDDRALHGDRTLHDDPVLDDDRILDGNSRPMEGPPGPVAPAPVAAPGPDAIARMAALTGLQRVQMVAWRDLDHPEAGGSEMHAARIAERWAAAGLDVRITASRAEGSARSGRRDGYRLHRPAGRYGIFPAAGAEGLLRRAGGGGAGAAGRLRSGGGPDATVEIWNGMPFFSPVWAPRPRVVFLHHVHDRMWDLVLPPRMAAAGRFLERRLAPPLYRGTPVITLSESSRQGIVDFLGLPARQVHVVRPGVDDSFRPGLDRDSRPLVVAVGRLVSYKRFDLLVEVLVRLRKRHPHLRAVIAGDGSERPRLEGLIAGHGASGWLSLPGRVDDDELLSLYQRAWVVASPSAFEGWGLTITEAAACATPAVVSPITGHRDAVAEGVTGFLAEPGAEMEDRLGAIIADPVLRLRMQKAALQRASELTWDRTATDTFRLLAAQVAPHRRRR